MADWTRTRARIAGTLRADPAADVTALRRQLREERLTEHIERVVNQTPPLTPEQRERLALLLTNGHRMASRLASAS